MKSLTVKLLVALGFLVVVVSMFHVWVSVRTTQYHLEESLQSLNRDLAANIAKETRLFEGNRIDSDALKGLFHSLMVINPSIELYLLDMDGKIMAFSAAPGEVGLERVSLDPIRRFMAPDAALPIWGNDPRDPGAERVFSVAPMIEDGGTKGYLYVVMGGTAKRTLAGLLETSYILRLSLTVSVVGVILALIAGGVAVGWLTRNLRRLAGEMRAFQPGNPIAAPETGTSGDEIAQLRASFSALATRVHDQISEIQGYDRDRRNLVAAISHDLRTPLTALQVVLDTLEMKEENIDPTERRRLLQLAGRQSRRLRQLVEDLFELAKLESPDFRARLEPAPLAELVQDVAIKLHPLAEEKNLQMAVSLPETAHLVRCDVGLLERVLENLIRNAIKFTPEGGQVIVELSQTGDQVVTAVTDTGPGIPADMLETIFTRFNRGEQTEDSERSGSGLGLAIAQRILGLHDSRVTVESELGHGTRFAFALPVDRESAAPGRIKN